MTWHRCDFVQIARSDPDCARTEGRCEEAGCWDCWQVSTLCEQLEKRITTASLQLINEAPKGAFASQLCEQGEQTKRAGAPTDAGAPACGANRCSPWR